MRRTQKSLVGLFIVVSFKVIAGGAAAQVGQIEGDPVPDPPELTIRGDGALSLNAATGAVATGGVIAIEEKNDGSRLHHFEGAISIEKSLIIRGSKPGGRVAISTNNMCFDVKKGNTLTLRNLSIHVQGLANEPCINLESGNGVEDPGGKVVLDNVEIRMWSGRNHSAVVVGEFATLSDIANDSGGSDILGNYEEQGNSVATVTAGNGAMLNFAKSLNISGRQIGLQLSGTAALNNAQINGANAAVRVIANGYLKIANGELTSPHSALMLEGAAKAHLDSTNVSGVINVAESSKLEIINCNEDTVANACAVNGAIRSADSYGGSIQMDDVRISRNDELENADTGLYFSAGASGTLTADDLHIARHTVGIHIATAHKQGAIDIEDVIFEDMMDKTGVLIGLEENVPVAAIREIEVTDMKIAEAPNTNFQLLRPIWIPKGHSLCSTNAILHERVSVRWLGRKTRRKVCEGKDGLFQ